jgi:wyosine [tRNA(Phe)-imidazoG37] synthetase (radical SAM superfamily)
MFVYGPVLSRRLGLSLAVSPIPPRTCTYDCIYCQLGPTGRLQSKRESFYEKEKILAEIVSRAKDIKPDFISFVGDGEPTLNCDLGWLIREVKDRLDFPVAVITNGSLLFRKDVRQDLQHADVVIPSLDAGNDKTFNRINRPHCSIDFGSVVGGQAEFRSDYPGQVWMETMLVKEVNDSEEELLDIKEALAIIKPDRIYLMTSIKPPAESWVELPDAASIERARKIVNRAVPIVNVEEGEINSAGFSDAGQAILTIGSRHPLRIEQALEIERSYSCPGIVKRMIDDKELIEVVYNGLKYLLPKDFLIRNGVIDGRKGCRGMIR